MAEKGKAAPVPPAKAEAEALGAVAPGGSDNRVSVEEHNRTVRELNELKESHKRVNLAVRKLAAAILTPANPADKGAGRRNSMAQAFQELAKEFGVEESE